MKKIILLSVFAFIISNANGQSFQWARQMGGTSNDYGISIATDAGGNVITTGFFLGTVDFDPGPATLNFTTSSPTIYGAYIQKLDSNGNLVWAKSITGNGINDLIEATGIVTDASQNVYVTGFFQGTDSVDFDPGPGTFYLGSYQTGVGGFILKLDSNGNFVFAKCFDGWAFPNSITIDSTNNIYTTGWFYEIVDFDPSLSTSYNFNCTGFGQLNNSFVSKLNQNGDFVWAKQFVAIDSLNGGYLQGQAIQVDGSGNVYTKGFFTGNSMTTTFIDMDPGLGTYLLSLDTLSGYDDINYLSKLDANGNFVWAQAYLPGNTNWNFASLKLDPFGNMYTDGSSYLCKFTTSGNMLWYKYENEEYPQIDIDNEGKIYTTGGVSIGIGRAASISKYDTSGVLIWRNQISVHGLNQGHSIALDGYGNVFATGIIDTTVSTVGSGTGSFTLTSNGGYDIFVCKLSPTNEVWPGDADNNNNVDNNDLLPIGLFYGQTGTLRSIVSNIWQAETSVNWGTNEPNGTDIKHADCDGDGTIDNNDTLAINLNFSSAHAIVSHPNDEKINSPDIYFVTTNNTYNAGDWVDAELWLGSSVTPVTNLYGVAFNINYPASLVQSGTENISYPSSWLGTPSIDAIKIAKIDALAATAYGAETRINQTNANGYGKIADFKFQIKTTLTTATSINLNISNYMANDAAGLPVVFNPQPLMVNVTVGVNEQDNNSNITISPNPFTSQTTITFSEEHTSTGSAAQHFIKITDVLGNVIQQLTTNNRQQIIDMIGYAKGIYFVRIVGSAGSPTNEVNRKIILN